MTEQPDREQRERDLAQQRERHLAESAAIREADRGVAHQRQLGVSWLAFKAGFFGALGVALASLIIGIVVGIFWLVVFSAILGAAFSN
jgi:hypothetical protein